MSHTIQFSRDQTYVETTFRLGRRMIQVGIRTARADAVGAGSCPSCGRPGSGLCDRCQSEILEKARHEFWLESNW